MKQINHCIPPTNNPNPHPPFCHPRLFTPATCDRSTVCRNETKRGSDKTPLCPTFFLQQKPATNRFTLPFPRFAHQHSKSSPGVPRHIHPPSAPRSRNRTTMRCKCPLSGSLAYHSRGHLLTVVCCIRRKKIRKACVRTDRLKTPETNPSSHQSRSKMEDRKFS